MSTLNISLPESMRDFVLAQVERGGYATASEYIRELVREAERAAAKARLETLLLEGINSGPARPFDENFVEDIRRRVEEQLDKGE